jgi:hypothetical protein
MPLPDRDFNQELEKTRGVAHTFEAAVRSFLDQSGLVTDREDYRAKGIAAAAEVLADRLDDLCHMHFGE